jgi:hypothetical protein
MMTTTELASSPPADTARTGRMIVYGIVLAIGLALAFAPFLFQDVRSAQVAARICVFIVLAASYDLLIGYTGIVSFAHTMFFGLGAYGAAIALKTLGPGWDAVLLGGAAGICRHRAGGTDRRVVASGEGDLLRHGHAGRGFGDDGACVAVFRFHGRRGRHRLQGAGPVQAGDQAADRRKRQGAETLRRVDERQDCRLLFRVPDLPRPVLGVDADRALAARHGAGGDPRKRDARRGDRLPRRCLPDLGFRHRGGDRGAGRHGLGGVAEIYRAGDDTFFSRS